MSRRLHHETLERRELLAAEILSGPRLVSVEAGAVTQIRLEGTSVDNRLDSAPRELKFRFDGTSQLDESTLGGIRVIGSGGDGTFGDGNEVLIQPGFLGFADDEVGDRVVVARFTESLPDDRYRIQIAGYDDVNNSDVFANGGSLDTNITALRDTDGNAILPADQVNSATPSLNIDFEVEVGPRVVAVVPQPVTGGVNNRTQAGNVIEVYFNRDPLSNPAAGKITNKPNSPGGETLSALPVVNPAFYQLFFTNDTVSNADDALYTHQADQVIYDPAESKVTLHFLSDIGDLAGPTDGVGTFRLRVGSGNSLPAAPVIFNLADEGATVLDAAGNPITVPSNDTFANSDIYVADAAPGESPQKAIQFKLDDGIQSVLLQGGSIRNTGTYVPPWPGAYEAPGSRDYRRDASVVGRIDTTTGINVFPYNFATLYGLDGQGRPLSNAITSAQRERAREIFDLFEQHLGVRFVETKDSGLQIVTGDLRAIQATVDTGAGKGTPYSLYRVNERDPSLGTLVLGAKENWYDGYGLSPDSRPSWFVEGLRGVGNLLGIGDLFELPDGVAAGGSSPDEPNSERYSDDGDFSAGTGPNGLAGFPSLPSEPDFLSQSDITLGQSLHRPESSDVDFYAFTIDPPADPTLAADAIVGRLSLETFAQRLEQVSLLDSLIQLYRVTPGQGGQSNYELVARNDDSYGDDSFLRVDLTAGDYVVGVSSTGNDSYDGSQEGTGNNGRSEGRYDLRMTFDPAFGAVAGNSLVDANGTRLDGDADGQAGGDFNFWFRTAPDAAGGATPRTIFVTKDSDGSDINDGSLNAPYGTVKKALAEARPGDIVRLLPSAGADGIVSAVDDPATPGIDESYEAQRDNRAYEFGRGGTSNAVLSDGETFNVPKEVTVMIDAGALLKFKDAKIGVGSESVDSNRELAAIQVLGTPLTSVVFTSYNDERVGVDTNPIKTSPSAGDWAGIELRNDVDYAEGRGVWEREGIFLDYVSHADMRYGGGRAGTQPPVSPIQMHESRPTLIYNEITHSANAAMSADPNSFREDNFHAPLHQKGTPFTSDYDRVGPKITGNVLTGNTINGLFIRVDTPSVGEIEVLTQSARFANTDIVHVISQVLTVAGSPGGPILLEDRPSIGSVTLNAQSGGDLAAGVYQYVLSYVTVEGHESLISLPTPTTQVTGTTGKVTLQNLPVAPPQFVGRKLYRGTDVGGMIEYELVQQLDRGTRTVVDKGQTEAGSPAPEVVPVAPTTPPIVWNNQGQLEPNRSYDYRFTFEDPYGGETQASQPTATALTGQDAAIELRNLPVAPAEYVGTNVYRVDPATGEYFLIAKLRLGETTLIDDGRDVVSEPGSLLGRKLGAAAVGGSKLLARFNARLTIDPGTIIKLNQARIETTFGAAFYAEGTDGKPIIFTSRNDDNYGIGGTFDTNGDGPSVGTPGDWGGIMLRQGSTGSLEHVDVRYGGGEAGGSAAYNALEILQADVRVVDSTFVDNADGIANNQTAYATRGGVGFNDDATIFIRGAQPILIGNVIAGGEGAAISINPDSLTFGAVTDQGRSTGMVDRFVSRPDNQGPLLLENQLVDNKINGMRVRSEVVTTDSVWDDTDIVHVVEGPIYSLTHHYHGALRLRSDADQSLVVKFGPNGSLIGGGRPLDIDDRIGGTLQVLGAPGFPVVLTSLKDSTIGAGFTPDGRSQRDTANTGLPVDANGNELNSAAAGDWVGLQLQAYVNDRNVSYVFESERADAGAISTNQETKDAQMLGSLAIGETAGDENERLGFTVRGTLAAKEDVDTYRFRAAGGTPVFFDIDGTSPGLDTVLELVNTAGEVIARSDNSLAEAIGRESIYVNPALPNGVSANAVRPLPTGLSSGNVESPNVLDAGFRVVLPGSMSQKTDYFIRVRSANAATMGQYELSIRLQGADEVAGSTVRGADIRYATTAIDISGLPLRSPLVGDVGESVVYLDPTTGDRNSGDEQTRETVDKRLNADPADAQNLGNLLTTDRGSLIVTGEIGNLHNSLSNPQLFTSLLNERLEDVDVYRVDLFAQQLSPDVFSSENRFVSTTFDIDYADELARVNTVLSVFDSQGRLILVGRDSNVTDDQGRPLQGVDQSNLAGGSAGTLDAFIGPVELPEGIYYVAVSSAAAVPAVLNQFFEANPVNPSVRLAPVNSVRRVVSDSRFVGSFSDTNYSAEAPIIQPAFTNNSAVEYTLDDIRLFVNFDGGTGSNRSTLASFNPFTGTLEQAIGSYSQGTSDIAIRRDGELYSYSLPPFNTTATAANTGNFLNVSPANAAIDNQGDDAIVFRRNNEAGTATENDPNALLRVNAMTFARSRGSSINSSAVDNNERLWVIGDRTSSGRGGEVPSELRRNILYRGRGFNGEITSFDSLDSNSDRSFPATGTYNTSMGPASDEHEYGVIDTGFIDPTTGGDGGDITGVASLTNNLNTNRDLVGVTDRGGVHVFNPNTRLPAPVGSPAEGYSRVIPTVQYGRLPADPAHLVALNSTLVTDPLTGERHPSFTGLSLGPQSVESNAYRNTLFATTSDGWLYAFTLDTDLAGNPTTKPANIFYNGRSAVRLRGLNSNASFNSSVGRPNGLAFSNLENNPWHETSDRNVNPGHGDVVPYDRSRVNTTGGTSLYFGFEVTDNEADNTIARAENDALGQIAPGGSHGSVVSDPIDLRDYSPADKPTLYFSYFLDVEDDNNYRPGSIIQQRDSFRVFAAGDDGQWRLLATNDDYRSLPNRDEYDQFGVSGIPVQTAFDNTGQWRQVRADLSPLAGNQNIRVRFDFSTAGAMRSHYGSVELVGVQGDQIKDNEITTIRNDLDRISSLQAVSGRDVVVPAAVDLADGDSFTVTYVDPNFATPQTRTVTFVSVPTGIAGPNVIEVEIEPTATAAQVAQSVAAAVPGAMRARLDGDGRISLLAATNIQVDATMQGGQSNPVEYQGDFPRLVIPRPDEAEIGERVSVTYIDEFGATSPVTFRYVDVIDPLDVSGDEQVLVVPGETRQQFAQRIREVLLVGTTFFDAEENLVFIQDNVVLDIFAVTGSPQATQQDRVDFDTYAVPVTLPAGDNIIDGESITIYRKDMPLQTNGDVYTFRTTATGATNEIVYAVTDTAVQVAQKFRAALNPNLIAQPFGTSGREVLIVEAASVAVQRRVGAQPASKIVSWEAKQQTVNQFVNGRSERFLPRAVPVLTHAAMNTAEVAEQLQRSLAFSLGAVAAHLTGYRPTADAGNYKIAAGDRIRLYLPDGVLSDGESISTKVLERGSFGLNVTLPGDEFGVLASRHMTDFQNAGALNNVVEGVYIDDIVIGMAERGEMVLYENFFAQPGNADYVLDPSYLPDSRADAVQPEYADEILVGPYSLEIRTADVYGVPNDYDPIRLRLDETRSAGRAFDSNDRLVDGAVTLVAPAGRDLLDGDTFVLDDGSSRLTFEFDSRYAPGVTPGSGHVAVPFDPAGTAAEVAASIRRAINSNQATDKLTIRAATGDSRESGIATSNRIELFGNQYVLDDQGQRRPVSGEIFLNPGSGRNLKLDMVAEETFQGRHTSRRVAVINHSEANATEAVEYVIYNDELAQAAVPGYVSGDTLFVTGKIGDAVNLGANSATGVDDGVVVNTLPSFDLDVVRVYLEAGQGIDIDLDTTGLFKVGRGLELPFVAVVEQGTNFTATELSFAFAKSVNGDSAVSGFSSPSMAVGETQAGATLKFTPTRSGYYDVIVSSVAPYSGNVSPISPTDAQMGEYFMSIRPTADVGVPQRDVLMVNYHFGKTDVNRVREQGQLIIENNFIRDSANAGIVSGIDSNSGRRFSDSTLPGGARLLRSTNVSGLIPGPVIVNNVIERSGNVAIQIVGGEYGPAATNPNAPYSGDLGTPNLFTRVINNTIAGSGAGTGISVSGRAAPTLLNNVIVGVNTGINVNAVTASGTVADANLFSRNGTNSTLPLGSSSIIVPNSQAVFQDPARSIYIPAPGSALIDSSFSSLAERDDYYRTVKRPMGLPPSPILAPAFDIYGQRRVDGAGGTSGGGAGANVFVDRGAIDRADVRRPNAVLSNPFDAQDRNAAGSPTDPNTVGDTDPQQSFVRLVNRDQFVNYFEIQLTDDAGTGLDATTVNENTVLVTENGRQLLPDRDFTFGYSENSRTIRLTPLAGVWNQDSVYEITLNNQARRMLELSAGGSIADGDQIVVRDDSGQDTVFEFDSGYTLAVPAGETLVVTGVKTVFRDSDTFTITAPNGLQYTFEINTTGSVAGANVEIPLSDTGTITEIRDAIFRVLTTGVPAGETSTYAELLDLAPVAIGSDSIQLGTLPASDGQPAHNVALSISGGLEKSGSSNSVTDGLQFSYTHNGLNVTFEFDSNGSFDPADQTQGRRRIGFNRTDSPDQIAAAIAAAIRDADLDLPNARAIGDGLITLGGEVGDVIDLLDSTLIRTGTPGVSSGAIPVTYTPSDSFPAVSVATKVQQAVDEAGIAVDVFSPGGGVLLFSGTQSVVSRSGPGDPGTSAETIEAVTDLAGNPVNPTRPNNETRFTVIMPNVNFDFGDAPQSYGTLLESPTPHLQPTDLNYIPGNGARHAVIGGSMASRLGAYVDTEADGQPFDLGVSDDAKLSLSDQSAASSFFTVANPTGSALTYTFITVPAAGELIVINTAGQPRTFEFVYPETNPHSGSIPVAITAGMSTDQVAQALLAVVRPTLKHFGGSIIVGVDDSTPSTLRLTAIDDEDGLGIVTFNQGASAPPAYFFGRYEDNGKVFNQSQADRVFGFLNPADPAGANVQVFVTGGGLIDAWVDFNGNGVFDEDGSEQVLRNEPVSDGLNTLRIVTPNTVTDQDTWLRIRLSDSGNTSPTGVTIGGEVEDYLVSVRRIELPTVSGDDDNFIALEDTRLRIDSTLSASNPPLQINRKTLFTNDTLGTQLLPVRYFIDLPQIPVDPATTGFPIGDDVLAYRTPQGGLLEVNRTPSGGAALGDDRTGSFLYTPAPDFNGVDSFRYRLSTQQNADGAQIDESQYETVNINVLPENDDPGASDEQFVTFEAIRDGDDPTLVIDASVLVGSAIPDYQPNQSSAPQNEMNQTILVRSIAATDPGGTKRTIVAGAGNQTLTTSRGGTLVAQFNSTNQWITQLRYTPADNFNSDIGAVGDLLLDEFEFTLFDDGISVLPDELDDSLTALAASGELGGDNLSQSPYFINNGVRNQFLRKPVTASEATGTATIRVVPRNDPPELLPDYVGLTDASGAANTSYLNFFATPDAAPVPTEDGVLVFPAAYLLANDAAGPAVSVDENDPLIGNDGEIRVIAVGMDDASTETLARGSISLDPGTGMITFTPAPNLYGEITFTYTVIDSGIDEGTDVTDVFDPNDRGTRTVVGRQATMTSTIFVEPVNDAPFAYDRQRRTSEDTPLTLDAANLLSGNSLTPSNIVVTTNSITLPDATDVNTGEALIVDGESLTLTATNGQRMTVEFNTTGVASAGVDRVVRYAPGDLAEDLASRLAQVLRATGFGGTAVGPQVTFTNAGSVLPVARSSSLSVDAARRAITIPPGTRLGDGERIVVQDTSGTPHVFEFTTTGSVADGVIPVSIAAADTSQQIAESLATVMLAAGFDASAAATTQTQIAVQIDGATAITATNSTSAIRIFGQDVILPGGGGLQNGELLVLENASGGTTTVEFGTGTAASDPSHVLVAYNSGDAAADIAAALAAALNDPSDPNASEVSGNVLVLVSWEVVVVDASSLVIDGAASQIQIDGSDIFVPNGSGMLDGQRLEIRNASGNATIVEFNLSGTPSMGADVAVAFTPASSASEIAIGLQEQLRSIGLGATADAAASSVPARLGRVSLQVIDAAVVGGVPAAAGEFDPRLESPFNESEQTAGLRIIEVSVAGETLNLQTNSALISADPSGFDTLAPCGVDEACLTSEAGGRFRFTIASEIVNGVPLRYFSQINYTPPENYNEEAPFAARELLTYKVIDNGRTTIPTPAEVRHLPPRVSVESGTLSIAVTAVNDPPTFDNKITIDVLERDDDSSTVISQFVSQVFAGPVGALDEVQNQQVGFLEPRLVSGNPSVMNATPVINYTPGDLEGSLTVFPAPDQIGQLVYEIVAFEIDNPTMLSAPQLVTINVRPVNDRPRINPMVAGTTDCVIDNVSSDPSDPNYLTPQQLNDLTCSAAIAGMYTDQAYSVSLGVDTNGDGFHDQATIEYTLREDNTRPIEGTDDQVQTGNYFIPLDKTIPLPSSLAGRVNVGSYTRIGLLDIYDVGPANELQSPTAEVPTGGPQTLELFDFPSRTELGGTLVPRYSDTLVDANGNPKLIGLLYTPPTDLNNINGGIDSFEYTVRDDNPGDGETYSLDTNSLVADRLQSTSRVQLNLNPVNDRPEFATQDLRYEVAEDSALQVINGFAFGIAAGPSQTANDENAFVNGQKLNFTVTSLSFDDANFEQFFDVFPTVDLQGQLRYKPAQDVFGTFKFAVVLNDDGASNSHRGDLASSVPITLTIDVLPVNDRPVIAPQFNTPETNPLRFQLSEDGTHQVLVRGDAGTPGLLDVFQVGPANEAENIVPGGNQTLSLTNPIPVTTAQGGTLTYVTPPTGSPYFQYRPREHFVGIDTFFYTVTDDGVTVPVGTNGMVLSDPQIASGTVTFEVLPVNDPPQFSGAGDVISPEDADFGNGRGVVTIENWATNVQAGPVGADDENGIGNNAGQELNFEILFLSGDSDLFTVAPFAQIASDGTASLNYTLAPDANGSATFTVQLFDDGPSDPVSGDVNESDIRTFTIDITPVNDPPTFVPGGTVTVFEDRGPYSATWATDVLPGPPDESAQSVHFRVTPLTGKDAALFTTAGQPKISSSGILEFTPAANANGIAKLQVVALDSEGAQSAAVTLEVVITPVNDFPSAVPDLLPSSDEDTIVTIPASQLLGNDIDPDLFDDDPDVLRLEMPLVQRSLRGAIVRFDPETHTVTYDPTQSRELQSLRPNSPAVADSFSYAISDREGRTFTPVRKSNSALVTINIFGVNDAPVANPDTPTLNPTGPTTFRPLDNDEDVDGTIVLRAPGSGSSQLASPRITNQPAFGTVTIDYDTGAFTYTPFTQFEGEDSFEYVIEDDLGAVSVPGKVSISPNAAPLVRDDNGLTFLGESVVIDILDNDSDSDSLDLSSVQIETGASAGTLTVLGDGTVRYTPMPGFIGRDSFQYTVADARGRRSGLATVRIQVVSSRLQNPDNRYDVNDDGAVTALDALLIINHLNRFQAAGGASADPPVPSAANNIVDATDPLPPETYDFNGVQYGGGYFDVSGDRFINELDALQVINELNRRDTTGALSEPLPESVASQHLAASGSVTPAASGEPVAPLSSPNLDNSLAEANPAGRHEQRERVDLFDSEEKWIDQTDGATNEVDVDVLDRLVAAQQRESRSSEDEQAVSAIDAAMAKLL